MVVGVCGVDCLIGFESVCGVVVCIIVWGLFLVVVWSWGCLDVCFVGVGFVGFDLVFGIVSVGYYYKNIEIIVKLFKMKKVFN